MTRTRRLLTVILSVFSLLLIATAGFAASRADVAVRRAESVTSTQPGDEDEQGEDEQGDDQGSAEGATGATGSTGSTGSTGDATTVDPEREAACNEAAGIVPPVDGTGTTDGTDGTTPDPVKLTGLDNAISHVLANCMKNPDSPGLVNALEHLVANQAKHEAHDAAKAERKAEQAARKAANEHGHGHDGDHGNPHTDGGSGNPHGGGNGGGNGHH
jgi:hypothetical protein